MGRRHNVLIMKEQSLVKKSFPCLFPLLSFVCCYLICTELELTFKGSSLSGEYWTALIEVTFVIVVCLSTLIKASNWNLQACLECVALTDDVPGELWCPPRGWGIMALAQGWVAQLLSEHWGLPCKPPAGKQWFPHHYVTNKARPRQWVSLMDGVFRYFWLHHS